MEWIRRTMQNYKYEKIESLAPVGDKKVQVYKLLVIFSTALVFGVSGFLIGHLPTANQEQNPSYGVVPLQSTELRFIYNVVYTLPPADHTNNAWNKIFPDGAGFVKHPKLSPDTSGIAVFHQLHCLNQIRIGYYQDNQSVILNENAHGIHDQGAHSRHCFDYLRQSIMCAADSNLEPVDKNLGGVTGWGNARVCRDFDKLSEWAMTWKDGNSQGSGQ